MTHTDYLKIKNPDTALAVRLAVTMGWETEHVKFMRGELHVGKSLPQGGVMLFKWSPFTDASIPYGLIRYDAVNMVCAYAVNDFESQYGDNPLELVQEQHESKNHAIINAYCQADPMGHWAKFIGEMK